MSRQFHHEVHPKTVGVMTGICAALYDLGRHDELERQAREGVMHATTLGYGNGISTLENFLILSFLQRGLAAKRIAGLEKYLKSETQIDSNDQNEPAETGLLRLRLQSDLVGGLAAFGGTNR
ncbi:hypothetical protein FYK55_14185 [Roseiconus nitratireducens]|uniref:Uncharacterized protein n=1 Tax=Roseiconus nitratireducens TaxID=2605748 RepID=A0A5M6D585_9BACT|nr:hypothetical protein [Roseiconus nitratireducens]KAA5542677.1 hypothetical protein FYK55_14185 [Roseiconus nitratireducens]